MTRHRYISWMHKMLSAFWLGMNGRFGLSTHDKPNHLA